MRITRGLRFFTLIALIYTSIVLAQVPATLNYQGFLTDSVGEPINGSVIVQISLYDSLAGGTPFWLEQMSLNLVDGRFSVVLGSDAGNPLNPESFTGNTYIGIKVGSDTEMLRQELTSVAYSLRADKAISSATATQAESATHAVSSDNSTMADSAKRIDFTGGQGPYCIFATSCPDGFVTQSRAGFLINEINGLCPYSKGARFVVGEEWFWCHPRLCCVN